MSLDRQYWVFATDKLIRYATVTSPFATAADMPLSYMTASQQPRDRTRFTDVADLTDGFYFDVDLTTAMAAQGLSSWRVLSIIDCNAGPDDTYQITGNLGYDSGELFLWMSEDYATYERVPAYVWEPQGVPDTILRVTIKCPSARRKNLTDPSGFSAVSYFDIGNLIISNGYASGDYGADTHSRKGSVSLGLDQDVKILTSESGGKFPRMRPVSPHKAFTLTFTGTETSVKREYNLALNALRRDRGMAQALLHIDNLNSSQCKMGDITYGLFADLQDVSMPDLNYYEINIKITGLTNG
jgi:hypothetical protein